jgi:hypothetical protein
VSEPWFDPVWFGVLFGSIVGGLGGTLIGVMGALAGWLAPQGKGRTLLLGGFGLAAVLGVVMVVVGLFALIVGQPYAIWYPITLCGAIYAIVCGSLFPVLRNRYTQAEQRRIDGEALRHS